MSDAPIPDLVVALGPRSVLALIGIVTLVAGVWHVDRTWDERGSKAYERAAKEAGAGKAAKIPQKELEAAFVFPYAFLIGWFLYAISNLFALDGSVEGWIIPENILAAAACLTLSFIASVPMGNAVRDRDGETKKKLGMAFVVTWIVLTVVSTRAGDVSNLYCPCGMVCIIASMKILWKHRKMGDSWEQDGKPNPNPVVYNMGGPLFVFGWFLYWLGMAGTTPSQEEDWSGLPIYYNLRTLLAFVSGCGMVPVVLMVDYAHDEGAEFTGFGTDGRYFGRFWESPIPFLSAWTLFGVAALLPEPTQIRQWVAFANCVLQGLDAGILIQNALYEGDMARKNKWSIPFVLLFLALAINIGLEGGLALLLSLPGAFFIVLGQKTVFGDRKRGDYFMQNHKANPNPIVYSYGEPFFMTGWILISLAMALPM